MAVFVLLIFGLVAHVNCDVGIGYRYTVPATSYDVPFGSVGGLTNDRKYYHIDKQHVPTGSIVAGAPSSELQTPLHEHTSFVQKGYSENAQKDYTSFIGSGNVDHKGYTSFVDSQNSARKEHTSFIDSSQRKGVATFNLLGNSLNKDSVSADRTVLNSRLNFGHQNTQDVQVEKHLYFYTAPEEQEEVRPRIITPPAPAKKNVKILFIKTPTFNAAPIQVPVLPQNEEKTLVYVLVKKPEESEIVLPEAAPTKPTKPEVYFIKYKTQKEAQEAISNIQDHNQHSGISALSRDSFTADTFAKDGGSSNQYSADQDVNLVSRVSGSAQGGGSSTLFSTPYTPVSSGESVNLQVHGDSGVSSVNGPGSTVLSVETPTRQVFASGEITNAGGSFDNTQNEFGSSTTASSLNVPSVSGRFTEEIKVHQLYGPPRN